MPPAVQTDVPIFVAVCVACASGLVQIAMLKYVQALRCQDQIYVSLRAGIEGI